MESFHRSEMACLLRGDLGKVEDDSMDCWMTLDDLRNLYKSYNFGKLHLNLPIKTGNAGECCDRYCRGGCGGN